MCIPSLPSYIYTRISFWTLTRLWRLWLPEHTSPSSVPSSSYIHLVPVIPHLARVPTPPLQDSSRPSPSIYFLARKFRLWKRSRNFWLCPSHSGFSAPIFLSATSRSAPSPPLGPTSLGTRVRCKHIKLITSDPEKLLSSTKRVYMYIMYEGNSHVWLSPLNDIEVAGNWRIKHLDRFKPYILYLIPLRRLYRQVPVLNYLYIIYHAVFFTSGYNIS